MAIVFSAFLNSVKRNEFHYASLQMILLCLFLSFLLVVRDKVSLCLPRKPGRHNTVQAGLILTAFG